MKSDHNCSVFTKNAFGTGVRNKSINTNYATSNAYALPIEDNDGSFYY